MARIFFRVATSSSPTSLLLSSSLWSACGFTSITRLVSFAVRATWALSLAEPSLCVAELWSRCDAFRIYPLPGFGFQQPIGSFSRHPHLPAPFRQHQCPHFWCYTDYRQTVITSHPYPMI
ncbi:hypothetical protein FA15DRAFT_330540 [Coprinopsis marcescibilis]|uniref:Uncharacterized protein n=1 Tax=Coprinopsis marcescibilis TaxID=230819 RepID=A0A5C3KYT9_COPMA|nr:hypothetical protein FA15DRAFT_330540 [Coprinopsis marcescibilis]